jgi:hypothetical protein
MCEFCEGLKSKEKGITWHTRSSYADDNICEYIDSHETESHFKLVSHEYNNTAYVGIEYYQYVLTNEDDIEKVVINPFSESIPFNYCPICGIQLSENIVTDMTHFYKNYIKIE